MRKRVLIAAGAAFILVAAGLLLVKPSVLFMTGFLTRSEKADANILIIEGWLSFRDLSIAAEEFRSGKYEMIFTTGLRATPEYYNVNTDGFLIFYPGASGAREIKKIEIRAFSGLDGVNSAHFRVWVNDSVTAEFTAGKRRQLYPVEWNGTSIDSVMIEFTNDRVVEEGDRNLFVKEIILDEEHVIPYLGHSVYDISRLDNKNRIINNMSSNAELTAKRLISLGIDTSLVIAVPGDRKRINRTLASALAVSDFLERSEIKVTGINIVSSGSHSRRTWMTFEKALDLDVPVGIIALEDRSGDKVRIFKTFRETVAYIWYSLVLLLY